MFLRNISTKVREGKTSSKILVAAPTSQIVAHLNIFGWSKKK